MITRRRDGFRLAALLPLLLVAAVGRGALRVDVENLAMKSVGTATDGVAALRAREFGRETRLLLLATPRAPDAFDPLDDREIDAWVQVLDARHEVAALEAGRTRQPGERRVAVTVRTPEDGRYAEAVESLTAAARASLPPTFRLAVAGIPPVELAIARRVSAERARILPALVAALAVVLLALYRSPVLAAGALLAPLAAVLLLDGLQGLAGLSVDPVSALLGPAVLTVGVASSVHVLESYRHALRRAVPADEASHAAARELRRPLLLTVATTIAGFLGLLTSPVPAVRRFGVLASVGVALAIAIVLLCLPSLLRLMHRPRGVERAPSLRAGLRHARLARGLAPVILAVSALGVAGGLYGMRGNRVDNDPLHVLPPGDGARRDAQTIARALGGAEVFELLLPPAPVGALVSGPAAVLRLVARVAALDGVVGPAGPPRVSPDGHELLTFLLAPGGSARREVLFARAEELAREAGWADAGATGLAVRVARDSGELVRGQRRGVLTTLAALFLVMAIGFRSPLLGLVGLLPNVLPFVLVQGAMGLVDRPLTVASSMIGTVMLGLVVDDTIHLLHGWRAAGGTGTRRMARVLARVTRPVAITTAVLCVGFAATLLGDLGATREFGALAVVTLVVALAADLVLLPALLLARGPRPLPSIRRRPACLESPSTTS